MTAAYDGNPNGEWVIQVISHKLDDTSSTLEVTLFFGGDTPMTNSTASPYGSVSVQYGLVP
jgi:hypothetical protein